MISLLVFVFGLTIGSFINCLVWRLHKKQTILGRSYCPNCKHQLAWFDNIPLVSYIFLRGKCRYCTKPISMQYPMVELIVLLSFPICKPKFFLGQTVSHYKLFVLNKGLVLDFCHDDNFYL